MRVGRHAWLLAPSVLLLLAAFVWPVGWLLLRAFTEPQPGLQNFALLWERPVYLRVVWNTALISAALTPACLLLGFPVAHAITHGGPRLRRVLMAVVLVPFWTSLLVRALATVILLQRNGPVNAALLALGVTDAPAPLLYNMTGLMLGALQTLLPFAVFPLHAAMARIEPSLMQAALTMGAHPVRAFLRVYLPLTLPGLMAGGTLVYISALGYYVLPAMLGGPREFMVAQLIQDQIGHGNWGVAGALSLVLLASTGLLLWAVHATVGLRAVTR